MREALQAKLLRLFLNAWQQRGLIAWLLWPLSLCMLVAVRFRQGLYFSGLLSRHKVSVPVVVVGNVVLGGTGKTPVVMLLLRHLQSRGWRPGVISRGYGRRSNGCREVNLTDTAALVGDEPALIKRATQVPVFVASKRIEAARALLLAYPDTDVLISDDGLQHYALSRDVEICLFDNRGTGNGFLTPAGLLREPWPRSVDLVLHTGARPAFTGFTGRRALAREAVRFDGSRISLATLAADQTQTFLAVAAIAQPESFFVMLRANGVPLSKTLALPDHFDYENWQCPADRPYTVLCTEKDALKLWATHPSALAVPLEFTPEPSFLPALDALLDDYEATSVSSSHGHTTS